MKLATIGIGNAGGKIVDRLLEHERATGRSLCRFASVFNTANIDLQKIEYVPEEYRILYGQTDERSKGHGVGADPDLGAAVTRQDLNEIERVLDQVPLHEIDAFLLVAGLGGGTGSGGAPVIASRLSETYDEPVYGLGILPSDDEGGRPALNAGRSLRSFADSAEGLVLFDNDAWRQTGDSVESGYERTNGEIVRRVSSLLAAGVEDGSQVSENAMDASDVRRTLGTGGVSTVAYAEADVESTTRRNQGLLDRLRSSNGQTDPDGTDPATKIHGLVRRAVRSRLTCPASIESAERALIVISGPPQEFSRKGLERSRQWVEEEIGSAEVIAGDDPRRDADALSATVLLSNVTDVSRIDELQERAVSAQDNIEAQEADRESEIQELVSDPNDELDPV
jgi:cell division GTPase FtsZ